MTETFIKYHVSELAEMVKNSDVNKHRSKILYIPMMDVTITDGYEVIDFPQATEHDFLKIGISYSMGGMNYFTGDVEPRGYNLSVTPVKKENKNGYTCESFLLFSGVKKHIFEANKYNKTRHANMEADGNLLIKLIYYVKKQITKQASS